MKTIQLQLFKGILMLPLAATLSLSAQVQAPKQNDTISKIKVPDANQNGKPFDVVEQMPQYPGGDNALFKFLSENVKYPAIAMEQGVQGSVAVRFVVNEKGNVDRAEVIRSVHPALDAEALRVVNLLATWIPGKQKGQNVSVWYTLPIRFKLQGAPSAASPQKVPLFLLDGKPLPAGFNPSTLKREDFEIEMRMPDTEAIRANLIERYGKDAANGVVSLTSKNPEKTKQMLKDFKQSKPDVPNEEVFAAVEQLPVFPGGDKGLAEFISKHQKYPVEALSKGVSGTVVVQVVVSSTGKVSGAQVLRGIDPLLDKEALRVVNSLPDWTPARNNGKNVSVFQVVPVVFKIK